MSRDLRLCLLSLNGKIFSSFMLSLHLKPNGIFSHLVKYMHIDPLALTFSPAKQH